MNANSTCYEARRPRGNHRCLVAILAALFLLLALGDAGLIGARVYLRRSEARYEGRIYPNVYALATPLGSLAPAEAAAALRVAADPTEMALLTLSDGEKQWAVSWREAGVRLDVEATVEAALAAGRGGGSLPARLAAWFRRYDVAPVLVIDPTAARAALERVAVEASAPAVDATLRLEGGRLVAVPGRPGRAVDVDAAFSALVAAVAAQETHTTVDLRYHPVEPRIPDATPLLAQASEVVGRRLELSAYDVLTDATLAWTLGQETITTWLRVKEATDGSGLALEVDREAVRATLAALAAEMGEGRGFRFDEATDQVLAALEAGGGRVALYVTHPERTYPVQPGDVFANIALRHGLPPAVLAEANPGLDTGWLSVGQELVIPSPDLLWPERPVPGKRIVISLSRQRMHVYENGNLLYDWPVSTGVADSPTLPGVFQVLEKVENAYASRWDLWMPHFLAVYRAGPDFYNGIHALPILSGGGRLWAGLLGRPASYGCIILGVEEAATLYEWAEVGVPVVIEP